MLLLSLFVRADEYDFDFGAIETKPYEYKGYLKLEDKFQQLNIESPLYLQSADTRNTQNILHLEAFLDFSYFYDIATFRGSFMGSYDRIDSNESSDALVLDELYVELKPNENHTVLLGKKSLAWGKGYYVNPVAFFDRSKDPSQPTLVREGYWMATYGYTKSYGEALENIKFDILYLPASSSINKEYTNDSSSTNIGMKLYLLLLDTDIDFILSYSDQANEKIGFDFSRNLQTNLEIHGELAHEIEGYTSYLLGFRYLSSFELTLISEYFYHSKGLTENDIVALSKTSPFAAKDYLITLASQKEPFDILYFTLYAKDMLNLQDQSRQDKLGFAYNFRNNLELDLSYNINSGGTLSEFGKKSVSNFAWLKVVWYF